MRKNTDNGLNQLLNDAQPEVRLRAVNQIRILGPDGSEFIEKLWDMVIDDPSREVREQCVHGHLVSRNRPIEHYQPD